MAGHKRHADWEEVRGAVYPDTSKGCLPPSGWADVATKQDLRMFAGELRREMHQLQREVYRSRMREDMSQLRAQMRQFDQRFMSKMYRAMAAQIGALLLFLAGALLGGAA